MFVVFQQNKKMELQKKAKILPIIAYVETVVGICMTLLIFCVTTGSASKELVRLGGYIYVY